MSVYQPFKVVTNELSPAEKKHGLQQVFVSSTGSKNKDVKCGIEAGHHQNQATHHYYQCKSYAPAWFRDLESDTSYINKATNLWLQMPYKDPQDSLAIQY